MQSVKFLGIHIDQDLSWSTQIENVCAKIASGIFLLRNLSEYCTTSILKTAYFGLIYPHINYGIALWGDCSEQRFMRTFILQKKAIRIVSKANFREHCRDIFKRLNILTLPCMYIFETIKFLLHNNVSQLHSKTKQIK